MRNLEKILMKLGETLKFYGNFKVTLEKLFYILGKFSYIYFKENFVKIIRKNLILIIKLISTIKFIILKLSKYSHSLVSLFFVFCICDTKLRYSLVV